MSPALKVSPLDARRFLRRVSGIDRPFPDVTAALAYHGYVQIDPINICGRMHDLILRNRVAGYREGDLMRHLHGAENSQRQTRDVKPVEPSPAAGALGPTQNPTPAAERSAFEHHLPNTHVLVAFPLEAWPHLRAEMYARSRRSGAWMGRLTPREDLLASHLLAEIAARGPLGSEDFEDDSRRARRVWGTATLVKSTLQKLFFHGRVLIAQRINHRRRYDLPERVLPAAVLRRADVPAIETARWLALLKLRQRRLAALKREELRTVEDAVQPIAIEGLPPGVRCPTLYCLREDVGHFDPGSWREEAGAMPAVGLRRIPAGGSLADSPRLLAPLDPLIYDRRVTAALWDFDYTWEAYTPPLKRVRGYYALPVLAGTEIVGHVDPKADRAARQLRIMARRLRRGHSIAGALRELARFLGLRR